MEEKIIDLLKNNHIDTPTIFLIIILLWVVTHVEDVLLIKSYIYGLFSKTFSLAKKKQISNKVRGTILKSVKEQGLPVNDILPSDLKVIWVNEEKTETFVDNNQVIVRIKQTSNPHENLITAVSEYVGNGLLHNVKRYLNPEVMNASQILMSRKVIQSSSSFSLTYFDENYIIPKINKDNELRELYNELIRIDYNGMFVGIMLNEFNKSGMSIYGEIVDPCLMAESKEFMRFLYNIATKASNEITDLSFNREYFRVAIFLSASDNTLTRCGITSFITAIRKSLNDGIETIYIFGLGNKRKIAKQIAESIDSDFRISTIIEHHYKHINDSGRRVPGVFYECEIFKEIKQKTP